MASSRVIDKDGGKKQRAFFKRLATLDNLELNVGIPASVAGKKHPNGDITIGALGAIHEFGLGVPERSFLQSTFDANQKKYGSMLDKSIARVAKKKSTAKVELDKIGEAVAKDVTARIERGEITPVLDAGTIAAKGDLRPLYESGTLAESIDYDVRKER